MYRVKRHCCTGDPSGQCMCFLFYKSCINSTCEMDAESSDFVFRFSITDDKCNNSFAVYV